MLYISEVLLVVTLRFFAVKMHLITIRVILFCVFVLRSPDGRLRVGTARPGCYLAAAVVTTVAKEE